VVAGIEMPSTTIETDWLRAGFSAGYFNPLITLRLFHSRRENRPRRNPAVKSQSQRRFRLQLTRIRTAPSMVFFRMPRHP